MVEYLHMNKFHAIKSYSETRWLSTIPMVSSFIQSYDAIIKYLKEIDPELIKSIEWKFSDQDLLFLQHSLIYIEKLYNLSLSLEKSSHDAINGVEIISKIIIAVDEMRQDLTLNQILPTWNMKCQSFADDLKRNFFENATDSCRRNLAVDLIFQDD